MHDASAIGEVIQVEALGLCEPGEGGLAAERGDTSIGGRIPVNTSGGLHGVEEAVACLTILGR